MAKITIECCGGKTRDPRQCLQLRCPNYNKALVQLTDSRPWVPTGYGNLYGEPKHEEIIRRVEENLKEK